MKCIESMQSFNTILHFIIIFVQVSERYCLLVVPWILHMVLPDKTMIMAPREGRGTLDMAIAAKNVCRINIHPQT